ncbi:MAG: tetratricopeptide repeat protein [Thermodesulfobacteriota bacterium]
MKKKQKHHRSAAGPQAETRQLTASAIITQLQNAVALQNNGEFSRAGKIYREVLATDPTNQDALHLSGLIAIHDQKFDTARELINRAIARAPNIAVFHISLGAALAGLHDYAGAADAFRRARDLDPDNTEALFQLGNLHKNHGKFTEAQSCYQQVLRQLPNHVATLNNLGNIHKDLGRFTEAITCYRQAIAADPTVADLYINMGNAYKDMLLPQEAINSYLLAIEVRPDFPDPYNNIGYVLQHTGKLHDALEYYQKALAIQPDLPEVYHNLGNVHKDMGHFPEAIAAYRKAVALRPDFVNAHTNILFAMNYDEKAHPAAMLREAQHWWTQQAAHLTDRYHLTNAPYPDRRLRIGYVSPDFCIHSVSFFFLSLLEAHDKNQFEIFCYSDTPRPDAMTARLQGLAHHWRQTTGLPDEAVADQIQADAIDILFDLTGHTAHNRLLVFARRPAPVQVAWLGYPNTTGVATIGYRITDAIADPPGTSAPFYTEKLVRLPGCFLCYSPPESAPAIGTLPAEGQGTITFGSFNNITKTSESVIRLWCDILHQVQDSRILLKSIVFEDPATRQRYLDIFHRYGISPNRIFLKKRTASTEEHLSLYNEVDIGLDPFPYNGTTTTCEALWMGVPVIALRGDLHCARVSASILTSCTLNHLIAENPEEYVRKAVALANDREQLRGFRTHARAILAASALCDKRRFAKEMEAALRAMWRDWCATITPRPRADIHQEDTMTTDTAAKLNSKGEELFGEGRIAEAEALFVRAIALDPGCATAYNNLGVLHYHRAEYDEALRCFRKTLEIAPEDGAALENIGELLKAVQGASPPLAADPGQPTESRETLMAGINAFPFWYHKIELPGGIVTPGYAPIDAAAYRIPADLSGKRVLDVGAWDGYWSFAALKRGAREVVAIDDFSDYLGSLEKRDRKAWETFDFCKKQLGYGDDRCKRLEMTVYEADEARLGRFDVIFFFGTLYHLRYPLLALDRLAALCDGEIFVETAILDDFSPYNGGLGKGYPGRQMVIEFYPGKEYGNNETNWWAPTLYCLINMVQAAGFSNCRGWKLTDSPRELPHCRGFAYGNKWQEQHST